MKNSTVGSNQVSAQGVAHTLEKLMLRPNDSETQLLHTWQDCSTKWLLYSKTHAEGQQPFVLMGYPVLSVVLIFTTCFYWNKPFLIFILFYLIIMPFTMIDRKFCFPLQEVKYFKRAWVNKEINYFGGIFHKVLQIVQNMK